MKKILISLGVIISLVLCFGHPVMAESVTQTVTFGMAGIFAIATSGSPNLSISTATAGSDPAPATDTSGKYSITTNNTNWKITGQITTGGEMPTGLTLKCLMTAPAQGGTVTEQTLLSASAKTLLTSINKVKGSNIAITYTLEATYETEETSSAQRTITYTLQANS